MRAQENVSHSDTHTQSLSLMCQIVFFADLLKFDNTYSWTRSKEVFYSVKVVPPETELPEITPSQTEATPIQT